MSDVYKVGKLYPVALDVLYKVPSEFRKNARVLATGEKRFPRKGEWFLSGADIVGYKALKDLSTVYYIGRLVQVQVETIETIVKYIE